MRKNVFGRQLKRDTNERKALFKGLMSSLVLEERIKTTEEKAKAIKGQVEKLVTKAKKRGKMAQDMLGQDLMPKAIEKLINEIAPRFQKRAGGYTRIVRLGRRFSDNANMVLMEWVESGVQNLESRIQNQEDKKTMAAEKKKKTEAPKTKAVRKKKTVKKEKPAEPHIGILTVRINPKKLNCRI